MNDLNWITIVAWIGPIVGGGIGLLGAVFGTYVTVKHTQGPRERAFAIKASVFGWIMVLLFVAAMGLIQSWYKLLLVIPYLFGLVFGIRKFNETQSRIRQEESRSDT